MEPESNKEKGESKKIKTKVIFIDIKSKYIIKKILFDYLYITKSLDIIKYNKKIQKRIDININDYKKCSEIYSSIEIEVVPVKNKYDKFINIKKDDEIYYHIYFDNNKEEIKRNYLNENEDIKLIRIKMDYQIKSFKELFYNCECVESIYFKKFCRNNIKDMNFIFNGCSSLKELNLTNFITNNVTNMKYMFYGCTSLKELCLNNFNTNNVFYMDFMFCGCSSLKELNLSNFNTNNVINMNAMFYGCSSLKELNISNFSTNNVSNIGFMFYGCSSLNELNLSNFNSNNVTDMRFIFSGCSALKELNIPDSFINQKSYIDCMFVGCSDELKNFIEAKYKNIKPNNFNNII